MTDLINIAKKFRQQIITESSIEDEELFQEQVFIDQYLDILHEAGELDNGIRCQHRSHGLKVDAYEYDDELNILTLVISDYRAMIDDIIPVVTATDIKSNFVRVANFFEKGFFTEKLSESIDESAEIHDLLDLINSVNSELRKIRFILITDGLVKSFDGAVNQIEDLDVSFHIWDIQRIYRFISSGNKKEAISINLLEEFGIELSCLKAKLYSNNYETVLAIVPGKLLADIYDKYGTRILERNVRAYLQARGRSINAGIRKTLKNEAEMFLAYNNGITVTAKSVEYKNAENVAPIITQIDDFQIVNGGQTTASLWHAREKDGSTLDNVYVQMKLTIVDDISILDEVVPLISKYSNSQNKVNTADFAANDPFHIELEGLSRKIWAPDPTGGNNQTLWFYERSRGSFDETRNRERTTSKRKTWDKLHPRRQKFDKLILAKVEKTWMLQPHVVSKGAQKNFASFQVDLKENSINKPSDEEYKRIISKIILWKSSERIVSAQKISGYRANIVTYTLAYILFITGNRLDLESIWNHQEISPELSETIDSVSRYVREIITNTQLNVTEYCKNEKCWESIKNNYSIKDGIHSELWDQLIDTSFKGITPAGDILNESDKNNIETVKEVKTEIWKAMSRWGKLTQSLEGWENGICYSIGKRLANGGEPTKKQANQGIRILLKAKDKGFSESDI